MAQLVLRNSYLKHPIPTGAIVEHHDRKGFTNEPPRSSSLSQISRDPTALETPLAHFARHLLRMPAPLK